MFLSAIYTVAVHLFMGLGFKRLLVHWLLGIAGMAGGSALAVRAGSRLPTLGDAHAIEASLTAIALLILASLWERRTAQAEASP